MNNGQRLLRGTLILTLAGFVTRILGFFYRIFLSHTIGAEGMGIYQLIFPIYALCIAFTVAGVQTAISRFVAAKIAVRDQQGATDVFLQGTFLSLTLSLAVGWILYHNSGLLAVNILGEPRTEPLLRLLAYNLPLSTIHACVSGYYYAKKETVVPSSAQLIEQVIRVATAFLAYQILLSRGAQVTPAIAVVGMIAGELVSVLYILLFMALHIKKQKYSLRKMRRPLSGVSSIVRLSFPLTANRVLLNLLNSAETILIPSSLRMSGLDSSTALKVYGVFTGMSLPLILFPSTITNSVSVMLLPSIAQAQALGSENGIRRTIETTLKYCLILGIFSTGVFFFFGPQIGTLLFHNKAAGRFIRILSFICPFLYLDTTMSSILNGLGKTGLCFIHNVAGTGIRIIFVLFVIPLEGIKGYLWGMLLSELVTAGLNLFALWRYSHLDFDAGKLILKPVFALAVSFGVTFLSMRLLNLFHLLPQLLLMALLILILSAVYLGMLAMLGAVHLPARRHSLERV